MKTNLQSVLVAVGLACGASLAAQSWEVRHARGVGNDMLGGYGSLMARADTSVGEVSSASFLASGSVRGYLLEQEFPVADACLRMDRYMSGSRVIRLPSSLTVRLVGSTVISTAFSDDLAWTESLVLWAFPRDLTYGVDLGFMSIGLKGNAGVGLRAGLNLANPGTGTMLAISGSLSAYATARARAEVDILFAGGGVELRGDIGETGLTGTLVVSPGRVSGLLELVFRAVALRLRAYGWCLGVSGSTTLTNWSSPEIRRPLLRL